MYDTITNRATVFFASEAQAISCAVANGGCSAGFYVVSSKDHPGRWLIEMRDETDGELLGYL